MNLNQNVNADPHRSCAASSKRTALGCRATVGVAGGGCHPNFGEEGKDLRWQLLKEANHPHHSGREVV